MNNGGWQIQTASSDQDISGWVVRTKTEADEDVDFKNRSKVVGGGGVQTNTISNNMEKPSSTAAYHNKDDKSIEVQYSNQDVQFLAPSAANRYKKEEVTSNDAEQLEQNEENADSTANNLSSRHGNPASNYLTPAQRAIRNQPQPIRGQETVKSIETFGHNRQNTATLIEQRNPVTVVPPNQGMPRDGFGNIVAHNTTNKVRLRDQDYNSIATYATRQHTSIGSDPRIHQTDVYGPDDALHSTYLYKHDGGGHGGGHYGGAHGYGGAGGGGYGGGHRGHDTATHASEGVECPQGGVGCAIPDCTSNVVYEMNDLQDTASHAVGNESGAGRAGGGGSTYSGGGLPGGTQRNVGGYGARSHTVEQVHPGGYGYGGGSRGYGGGYGGGGRNGLVGAHGERGCEGLSPHTAEGFGIRAHVDHPEAHGGVHHISDTRYGRSYGHSGHGRRAYDDDSLSYVGGHGEGRNGYYGHVVRPRHTRSRNTKRRSYRHGGHSGYSGYGAGKYMVGDHFRATNSHRLPPDALDRRIPRYHAYGRNIPYDTYDYKSRGHLKPVTVRSRSRGNAHYDSTLHSTDNDYDDAMMMTTDEETVTGMYDCSRNATDDDYETTDSEMGPLTEGEMYVDTYLTKKKKKSALEAAFAKITLEDEQIFHSCFQGKRLKSLMECVRKFYSQTQLSTDAEYEAMELKVMQEVAKCVRKLASTRRSKMTWQVVVGRKFVGLLAQDTGQYIFLRKNDIYILITGCSYLRKPFR